MPILFDMDNKIELVFYKKDGNNFEDFIVKLYKIKYPNLVGIKPQGSKGDGANDGYLAGELLLQVYAPEKIEAKKAIAKLKHDFQRVKDEDWKFAEWHFVVNDKFQNIHRDVHHTVDKLKVVNPNIDIKLIDSQTLKDMIYDLQIDNSLKIHVLLEMDRDISNFGDFEKFELIIDFLSKEQAIKNITTHDFINFSKKVFLPDGIKKLEINIQDEYFSKTFGTYIEKSIEIIEEFKDKVGLDEFESVGQYIQDIYSKYEKKVVSEEALLKTHKEIYNKIESDQNLETSLWITIAYFFDICHIGAIK